MKDSAFPRLQRIKQEVRFAPAFFPKLAKPPGSGQGREKRPRSETCLGRNRPWWGGGGLQSGSFHRGPTGRGSLD